MAIDSNGFRSRRGFLTALVGAASGVVAATLTGAQRVLAAGDDTTLVRIAGNYNDARNETLIVNNTNNQPAFRVGSNQGGDGVQAFSQSGSGVAATSYTGSAVRGNSQNGAGVHGISGDLPGGGSDGFPAAVLGEVKLPASVSILGNNYATSGIAQGVQGSTSSPVGYANTGWATAGGTALVGISGSGFPQSSVPAKTGVYGYSHDGRGGVLQGKVSQLRLVPAAGAHPHSGQAGDLFMDHAHHLWLCQGGSSWHQLA